MSPDNNHDPQLDMNDYIGAIDENSGIHTSILTINVTDGDKPGSNDIVKSFTLSGEDASFFYIEMFGNYGILRSKLVYICVYIHVHVYLYMCNLCVCVSQ